MTISLVESGIPGPHMMRENRFSDDPRYRAITQGVEQTSPIILPADDKVELAEVLEPVLAQTE